jgi:hypothetical protein
MAWAGVVVAFRRLGWRRSASSRVPFAGPWPSVSIVVPARNEERNLPPLLESLRHLDYPSYEVLVIDDNSTDRTGAVAAGFDVRVLSAPARPAGWNPKNWACHEASRHATGEIILFTDADTVHRPGGLKEAVGRLRSEEIDLLSCLPYHRCPTWWERMLGPFHALVYVATAPRTPTRRRVFALGQFLLFKRGFYDGIGGHAAIASQYPDDFALANLCFEKGGRYRVFTGDPFFEVRMYASFVDFVKGTRRNFQAGMRQTRAIAGIDVTLVAAAMLAGGRPGMGWLTLVPAALILALVAKRQRAWGQFSPLGVLFFPIPVAIHAFCAALALWDWARGGAIQWKDRELTGWTATESQRPGSGDGP